MPNLSLKHNSKNILISFLIMCFSFTIVFAQTQQENKSTNVTLSIQPHLTFVVNGVNQGNSCPNAGGSGIAEITSSNNTINFGSFTAADRVLTCQQTVVSTNSTNGYNITIQQDHDIRTAGGDIFNKFYGSSGTADTWAVPEVWSAPVAPYHSYFGFTTNDTADFPQFIPARYAGFQADNTEYQVVTAPGPVSDDTHYITYQIQFDNLQESGLYNNTITYIASTTF